MEVIRPRVVLTFSTDPATLDDLSTVLSAFGFAAHGVTKIDDAVLEINRSEPAFTMVDLSRDDDVGVELLRRLRVQQGEPGPIIVLTNGHGLEQTADAAALGAQDILPWPCRPEELDSTIKSALSRPRRRWGHGGDGEGFGRLYREMDLWQSARMQDVRRIIDQAAQIDVTVLIGGETGVGKDIVARAIHALSPRAARPFVKVNCAAVPRDLLESELFGHERGSFTGADRQKIGKFEAADHGTIFLDEIGDLHPALQGKLLHVLQDGQFSRVGGRSTIKVDVRVLAATNRDLEAAVAAGSFREDLYYRLNVIRITVPPLRERPEEIPILVAYFLERFGRLFGREGVMAPPEVLHQLFGHRFPGNVRELENIVKRMIVLGVHAGGPPGMPAAEASKAVSTAGPESLRDIGRKAAQAAERQAILRVLEQTHWNRVKAAKLLRISYRALLYKIKEGAIEPVAPSSRPHW